MQVVVEQVYLAAIHYETVTISVSQDTLIYHTLSGNAGWNSLGQTTSLTAAATVSRIALEVYASGVTASQGRTTVRPAAATAAKTGLAAFTRITGVTAVATV